MAGQCAAAGLSGSRLDDFVLAVHEIAAELGITQHCANQWIGAELQRLLEGKRKAGEA